MGTLYREIVEYKYQRLIKLLLKIIYVVLAFDVAFILYSAGDAIQKSDYVGYGVLSVSTILGLTAWRKCKRRYRYAIIDKELIIERFDGNKRKVELNLNIKNIVSLEKLSSNTAAPNVEKEYTFTCTGRRGQAYRCIFEKDGKLYSFNFEPSNALLKKIEAYRYR